jgi:hypothetical protein
MIKVIRAYEIGSDVHVFSIVASDKGFKYVFDADRKIFDPKKREKMLMEKIKNTKSKYGVDDYLSAATVGLTMSYRFGAAREESSEKIAVKEEQLSVMKSLNELDKSPVNQDLISKQEDLNQVLNDYPDLYDQLEGTEDQPNMKVTADGMFELVMAALGGIDPEGPNAWILDMQDGKEMPEGFIPEIVFGSPEPMTAAADAACPPATQDITLNITNRQNAIDNVGYGPLNPAEPNDEFWQGKADRWKVTINDAKKSLCGNCAAFIQTSKMQGCIAQGLQQGDENVSDSYDVVAAGDLGYCEALDFKCASSRTCDAWIAGGPVTDETGQNVV